MTETTEKRVNVTVYRDVQVQVDEYGRFYATPKGARKERQATHFYEIKATIDKYIDRAKARKRKPCNVPFYYWNEKQGVVCLARYLGTRGRDTSTHSVGHACADSDDRNFTVDRYYRKLRVLPDEHAEDGKLVLEHRFAEFAKAKAALDEAVQEWTKEVECPHLSYAPDVDDLDKSQNEMIVRLKLATDAKEEN